MAKEEDAKKDDAKDAPVLEPPTVRLGNEPMPVKCGSCKKPVVTKVEYQNGHCAYICGLCLCAIGCWICCCLPLLPGVKSCKDVHHSCPECETELGTFHKNYYQEL